jgi:MFS family permease
MAEKESLLGMPGSRDDGLGPLTRKRNLIAGLLLVGLAQVYALRVLLSVAIIPIAKQYGYDNATVGLLSSAFFIGYLPPQMPGGWAAGQYGGWLLMMLAVLIPSVLTILTPPACGSFAAFMTLRILTGFFEAVAYPSVHALAARWTPQDERASFIGTTWSGAYIGTALTLPITGALVNSYGWESAFYVFGMLGCVWAAAWGMLGASSPELHRTITAAERKYILQQRGGADAGAKPAVVPWFKLLTHPAPIAIAVAHTTHNWLFYTMLTWLPSYLNQQLHFDVQNSGAVALLPYLACFLCSQASGLIADSLTRRGVPVLTVRRGMQTVGELIPAAALGAAGYIVNDVPLVIALLTIAVGFSGLSMAGYASNHLDIAPQYAGVLLGFTNTAATLPGILAPILVGDLVAAPHNDVLHWQYAFLMASGIAAFGWLVFVVFARAELLPELLPAVQVSKGTVEEDESEEARLVVADRH